MTTLIFPLKLATTSIIFGLIALNSNPVKAAMWVRNDIVASKDNYFDSRFPNQSFGDAESLAVGCLPGVCPADALGGGVGQAPHIGWNLQTYIDQLTPYLDAGAEIRNLEAKLVIFNPNEGLPPISGIEVVKVNDYNSWNEASPVNLNPGNYGEVLIEDFGLTSDSNELESNKFNKFIRDLLQNKTPEFSIAIEAVASISGETLEPLDNILSTEGGSPADPNDPDNTPTRPHLDLTFEVWNEGFKILEDGNPTPNFKLQSLAGDKGNSLNEHRLVKGRGPVDGVLDETHWIWSNNIPTEFELQCSNNQAIVTFFANDDNSSDKVITSPVNSCGEDIMNGVKVDEGFEGLKLFSVVKWVAANTSMEICVNEADGSPISDFCSLSILAVDNGGVSMEEFFHFTDETKLGSRVTNLKGEITMGWAGDNNPQEASRNQRVAIQLIPLSTYSDPGLPAQQNANPQNANPQNNNTNEPSNAPSVPESTSVFSLILLGLCGLELKLFRKHRN